MIGVGICLRRYLPTKDTNILVHKIGNPQRKVLLHQKISKSALLFFQGFENRGHKKFSFGLHNTSVTHICLRPALGQVKVSKSTSSKIRKLQGCQSFRCRPPQTEKARLPLSALADCMAFVLK